MSSSNKLKTVITAAATLLFSAALLPASVKADEFHYVNILIGDRAADMGGAYTAISDNASGCSYNPAGIAFGQGSNLSASVNGFSYSNKKYKNAMEKTDGTRLDWNQTSSVLLPNFFGATYDSPYGTLGISYAVPDSVQRRQKQRFFDLKSTLPGARISEYDLNINDVDNQYLFGPSYAVKLRDNFSLGVTLYASYHDSTVIRNGILFLNDTTTGLQTGFEWRNSYIYRTEWGLKPTIGMIWSPTEKLAFGLTAAQHYLLRSDHLTSMTVNTNVLGSDPNSPAGLRNRDDNNRDLPLEIKAGIAYFPSASLLLSADLSYHDNSGKFERDASSIRYTSTDPATRSAFTISDNMAPVLNLALGAEYYLNDRYALRGGLYTDFANTDKLRKDGLTANQPEHIDIYGATWSLTRFTRSTSTTLGLGYAYGSGDAQVIDGSTSVQKVAVNNLNAFLSAAYSF
jgi:long-chain fatty acid transport protein